MPTNEIPAPGPNAGGRKKSSPLCMGPADKDLTGRAGVGDRDRHLMEDGVPSGFLQQQQDALLFWGRVKVSLCFVAP